MHLKGNGVWNRQLPSDRFNARKRKHICLTKKTHPKTKKKNKPKIKKKTSLRAGQDKRLIYGH